MNILLPDNEMRKQAEESFNNIKQHPDYCVKALLQVLRTSQHSELRGLATVLLRKCIVNSEHSLYPKLSAECKQFLKSELLEALRHEPIPQNRSKLVYAISGFVSGLLEKNEFPEFIPTMFEWAKQPSPVLRESAIGIFNLLTDYLMEAGIAPYLIGLKQIFEVNLRDTQNPRVRLAALEATCSTILVLDKQHFPAFQVLVGDMLNTVAQFLNTKDSESATAAIECFIEIAAHKPSFWHKNLNSIVAAMFEIAKSTEVEDEIRHLATEFIISLTESSPTAVKKIPNFVETLFPFCMSLMLDIEHDEEEWQNSYEDEELELTNYDVGLESLDRLALALGGQLVQPVAFKYIPQFLNHNDWKHRHTGLMSIAQTAEGCAAEYESHLQNIVRMVVNLFNDPHPRVRYAAIHCAAQLSSDFQGTFQEMFHSLVMPALLKAMDDQYPKVKSHAATAVVNFVEDCDKSFIQPYMDQLLSKLLNLLRTGRRYVQEQSLSAISAVADCAENLFEKYYDAITPFMKEILLRANATEDRKLRARAIECVSLIGVAVGKEKFGKDAKEIMEILIKTLQAGLDSDDPQYHNILQAWARIAKCLGEDFVPYLPYIMPQLLQTAQQQPEVVITDANEDEDEEEEGMESVTLTIKGVGNKRVSIRTSTLEEKSLACSILYSCVTELKEYFMPYIEPVTNIMVQLLQFAYLEDIRETAASIMPRLLEAVKAGIDKGKSDKNMLGQLFYTVIARLLEAIDIECETTTAIALIDSLNDCIKVLGENCLNEQQMQSIVEILRKSFLASLEKKQSSQKTYESEEDEEERDELENEILSEEQLLTIIAETVGQIMKSNRAFIPYFINFLWPIFINLLNPNYGDSEHKIALCVVCDFIESGGSATHQFFDHIVPALFNYASDKSPEVRQAAVYGIGACAEFGGEPFEQVIPRAIEVLLGAITRQDAKNSESKPATANAVSALFKFIQFRSNNAHVLANRAQYLQTWLQSLPVGGDNIEARIVHGHLINLIQQNNPIILGQNQSNIPKILQIFADIVNTPTVDEETQAAIIQIVRQISQQPQFMQQAMSTLTPEQQKRLQTAIMEAK